MNTYDYTALSNKQLEKEFGTSLPNGLTSQRVSDYQKKFGRNALEEKGTSSYALFLRQFKSPFTYLLLGAALLSLLVGDILNAVIIALIVIINGSLGFYQEYSAEKTLKLLKAHLIMNAKVIRDGKETIIPNTELVPGDIIKLQPGDYIPADIRFLEGSVAADESIITGESAPAKKIGEPLDHAAQDVYQALNLGFLGTTVTAGSATALVIGTGKNTLFGSISALSLATIAESGFQKVLTRLSSFILAVICVTVVGIFVLHLIIKGTHTDIIQLLLFCIAIALGITPEALPTVTTFALSRGALQLARHNVIVKRLAAIEDLGAITVLCTDKTGTLTENKMTVAAVQETGDKNLLLYALLASKKSAIDPFDKALLAYASEEVKLAESQWSRVIELPFDPAKRRNMALVTNNNEQVLIVRGAYESIAPLCATIDALAVTTWIEKESKLGNRVIAIASKKLANNEVLTSSDKSKTAALLGTFEQGMHLAGLIAFQDPIKKTAVEAIAKARRLGITIKMVTGDSKEVACAVALAIGLVDKESCALTGSELEALSPEKQLEALKKYAVFARVVPEQKFKIVTLLKTIGQDQGKESIVGFLGEGINDAPALKVAHVGLAVQGASDIAQDAADIILLRKSLLVIIEGIALGRQVFSNTIKYIVAVLSSTFGNFYSLACASLIFDFLPQLPIQVLLVNLLSDFPMVAIATDTVDPDELKKPYEFSMRGIGLISLILGLVCPFFDFSFFALFYHFGPAAVQTNWFIQSILMELALIYSVRTRQIFFRGSRPSFILLALSLIIGIITILLPFTALGRDLFHFERTDAHKLLIVGIIVVIYFITTDAVKLLYLHLTGNGNHTRNHRKSS